MSIPALMPCPFCGHEASFSYTETRDGEHAAYVRCTHCGAQSAPLSIDIPVSGTHFTETDAAALWNRRNYTMARKTEQKTAHENSASKTVRKLFFDTIDEIDGYGLTPEVSYAYIEGAKLMAEVVISKMGEGNNG